MRNAIQKYAKACRLAKPSIHDTMDVHRAALWTQFIKREVRAACASIAVASSIKLSAKCESFGLRARVFGAAALLFAPLVHWRSTTAPHRRMPYAVCRAAQDLCINTKVPTVHASL